MNARTLYISKREDDAATQAIAIHCSDHRFQTGFNGFLTEGLKLTSYALQAIPGGGHYVTLEHVMPKFFNISLQSLSFLVKRTRSPRIILIGHDDCLFFKERVQFFFPQPELNQKQIANLRKARKGLLERFPGLSVELYFAVFVEEDSIEYRIVEQN